MRSAVAMCSALRTAAHILSLFWKEVVHVRSRGLPNQDVGGFDGLGIRAGRVRIGETVDRSEIAAEGRIEL
jgi:hypothetical protein